MKKMVMGIGAFAVALAAMAEVDPAFSPGFFWIINGKLDQAKLNAQLDDKLAHGCRSICWHPLPKGFSVTHKTAMDPDYLTDEYLAFYSNTVEHAAANGMNFWLYDEGGWPSGSACGLVMKGTGDTYKRRYLVPKADGTYEVELAKYNPAKHMPHPSVIEPGATERFIELTHERIKKYCGHHFGKTIRFAFMDEPVYPFSWPGKNLGWCTDFAEQFKARKGYDILPYAKAIVDSDAAYATGLTEPLYENRKPCTVTDEIAKVRIDYYDVMSQLFLERFMNPIRDWCRKNGLKSGGHFGGEDQVEGNALYGYGHIMRDLRALDCPGVDVIWRQLWPTNDVNMPFPRYAASTAHQKGDKFVLSETFAVYGASMSPLEMKWVFDYLMVRGVNTFVISSYPYAADDGISIRQFGPSSHTWDFMKPLFDYATETSAKLSEGRPLIDTAVYFDVRGIWAGGQYRTQAADLHVVASRKLDRLHIDHDFVDDDAIAAATVKDGRLVVGEMAYETIVLPTWKWMDPKAAAKLDEFVKGGGRVIRGVDDWYAMRPSANVHGKGAEDIRVTKRLLPNGFTRYFVVNESMETRDVVVANVGHRVMGPAESFFYDRGVPFEAGDPEIFPDKFADEQEVGGWAPALGDWRARKGESFSGVDVYRTTFTHKGGKFVLDLGKVCWWCRAKLNGVTLPAKGFPPYAWDVELKDGENTLEVEVANTQANKVSALNVKTAYDRYLPAFNRLNHESGLFGPVVVKRRLPKEREDPKAAFANLTAFGDDYTAMWSKAFNDEIDARIEKYRKQDYVFDGFKPGEEVEVEQVTSDFQVGCNMFNFGQLGKSEWDAQYRATWEKGGLFNAATIPFYWASFEHERGKPRYVSNEEDDPAYWAKFRKDRDYRPVEHWTKECPWAWRRPAPDRLIAFCKANGVSMHGHCIIYPAWDPDWIKPIGLNDREAMWPLYEKRIREIAAYYGSTFDQWDIVNESWNRKSGLVNPNDDVCVHNGLWGRLVPVPKDYTYRSFKVAEEVFPKDVKLVFNDAAQDGYFAFSKSLHARGAKIDVQGFQMHIFSPEMAFKTMCGIPCTPNGMDWRPAHQIETFQKLDRLGCPIHLSEVTIPAPRGILPDKEADEAQARMIRDNFRLWFSWPSIYRITYWNLVDGTGAEILASGMYNKDLTKKPAYWAIDRLVNHEWRTKMKVKANENGTIAFRGFKGKYEFHRAK